METDVNTPAVTAVNPTPTVDETQYALTPQELAVIRDVIMRTQFPGSDSFGVSQLLTKLDYWLKKAGIK